MWRSLLLLSYVAFASACCPKQEAPVTTAREAIAVLKGLVNGTVTFKAMSGGGTHVEGTIRGLTDGRHGFHVHEFGDLRGCTYAKGHYNPTNQKHGSYDQTVRHVGDLKELTSLGGVASIGYMDQVIKISGQNSIIGRMLVVHAGPDDKGTGGNAGSLEHGNAGARVNCAVIGIKAQ